MPTALLTTRAAEVAEVVGGRPSCPGVTGAPVVERVDNLTTSALLRFRGAYEDGEPWSLVAKVLRPASAAPAFAFIPAEHHAQVLEDLHWLDEPRVYRSALASCLPPGIRMPRLHGVDEGADRVTLWLEDVADVTPWSLQRYARTARALGAAAGRWSGARAEELGLGGRDISRMFFGKVLHHDLPLQADDAFWEQPAIATAVDGHHRRDLLALAERVPAMLGRLAALPVALSHGDACPANFLEPGDGAVVGIDWSYCHVGPAGSDLAQLLAGRFEAGLADPGDLPAIAAAVRAGFLEGWAAEGPPLDPASVDLAWATHLAVRSVFSALDVEDPVRQADLLHRRAALARFGLDLGLAC